MSDSSKEREILAVMRRVLGDIVKETTPSPGTLHPLSQLTIEKIRHCFGLIAARERELADAAGAAREQPHFSDEPRATQVVSLDTLKRTKRGDEGPTEH